jgi:6-phosphofructokinase 1
MNGVICSLTKTLKETYQVPEVLGIRGGWWGFHKPENLPPIELDVKKVDGVQHTGGTMLGSSRGGFDADKILKSCIEWKVNMLFVIGGDGSHRGAMAVADLAQISKIPMSVVGIPKTIDNDIGIIDRSFGFESAVAEAKIAIKSAKVEASCAPNGIGVVKLMGRDSGYIAAHSTISSHGDVDLLLIPELKIDFNVNSKTNIFNHLNNTLLKKGHAVVVLSEGAGAEHLLQESTRNSETSADGTQPKLPPIGVYMKKRIQNYFNDILKKEVTVKYIDPSYMIRSVPANAFDSVR